PRARSVRPAPDAALQLGPPQPCLSRLHGVTTRAVRRHHRRVDQLHPGRRVPDHGVPFFFCVGEQSERQCHHQRHCQDVVCTQLCANGKLYRIGEWRWERLYSHISVLCAHPGGLPSDCQLRWSQVHVERERSRFVHVHPVRAHALLRHLQGEEEAHSHIPIGCCLRVSFLPQGCRISWSTPFLNDLPPPSQFPPHQRLRRRLGQPCYKDTTIAHQMALPALRFPAEMEPPGFSAAQVRRYTLPRLTSEARRFASNNGYIPTASTLHSSASGLWGAISSTVGLAGSAEGKEKSGTGTATGWYSWLPEATFEIVVDRAVELPQVNPKFKFHRYRFLYGVGLSEKARNRPGCIWDSIVKADLSRKTAAATWQRDHCYPSEPLFVPRPSAADGIQTVSPPKSADEDDGALLSIVLDSERNRSFLLVLDARTLEELGRADLPAVVPISFAHGSFKAKA
ncbi:retinal pigment epithelial membrane protein-domain-containing protein, partial [Jimgerdemannia flammicorona]